jgi:antibiotic biosynthesis monooxygenase (ABM) superfamily enzyme
MHAVAASWKITNESADYLRGFEEQVMPFLRTLPGFVAARVTRDHEAAVNHTLTLFTERAEAENLVEIDSTPERKEQWDAAGVELVGEMSVVEVLAEFDARAPSTV